MRLLLRARNRSIAIEDARIVPAEGSFDLVLDLPEADIRPGLINAHEHLHRNHYGRLGRPPYANACAWAADIQRCDAEAIAAGRALARREALLEGAWKNLFAGVTSVVHHDPWEADFDRDFPLRVVPIAQADSLGMGATLADIPPGTRFCLHLAEGIDGSAAEEVRSLDSMGRLDASLVAVHGVGMDEDAVARFRVSGAALVWCPSSNLFLLDRTAPAALLAPGVDLLIGSDSLLTGEGDLLDELGRARSLGLVGDARIEEAVGVTAARVLGLPAPSLEPGAPADLALLARPLLEARAEDVLLTLVGGQPRVAHPDIAARFGIWLPPGKVVTRGGVTRWTSLH
jgi:cytosine/adenosine deaminase-related metal-dependent hydrolase